MIFFKAHAAVASGCFEISEKWCQHNKQQKHARSFWKARLGGQYSFRRMKRRVPKNVWKQTRTDTHTQILSVRSLIPFTIQANRCSLCGGCSCRELHMLCFDVRHWFRSSCRLAAVRRWRVSKKDRHTVPWTGQDRLHSRHQLTPLVLIFVWCRCLFAYCSWCLWLINACLSILSI